MSESRVVVVSGGSRGLGLAIVDHFLAAGDRVATFSRSRTVGIERLQRAHETDARFLYQQLDAADEAATEAFVKKVLETYSRVDVLINNAAVDHDAVLAMAPMETIDQMLDINLRASLVLAKECSRAMLVEEAGCIVNISSIVAGSGFSGLAAYAATKAGQEGMTRALARELGPRNIRVNAIAPGYLETDMSGDLDDAQRKQIVRRTPLGRLGTPNDIVPCIEFLISPAARFLTGQVITVDGGATA